MRDVLRNPIAGRGNTGNAGAQRLEQCQRSALLLARRQDEHIGLIKILIDLRDEAMNGDTIGKLQPLRQPAMDVEQGADADKLRGKRQTGLPSNPQRMQQNVDPFSWIVPRDRNDDRGATPR